MSKESYARGFCKAAEAAGVDPEGLAKFANEELAPLIEAAKKTQTNPTIKDLYSLGSLDANTVRSDLGNRTIADYLNSMYSVNPDATVATMSALGRKGHAWKDDFLSRRLSYEPADLLRVPYEIAQRAVNEKVPDARPLANLNYAVATNMLDRIGRSTGRPMWDVKNARPTPYGLGIGAAMSPAHREAQRAVRTPSSIR